MLRHTLFSFFFVLSLTAVAKALPADQDDGIEDIGIFTPLFFAELQDVELMGDRAYVFGVGGLVVVDISQPESPTMLGRYVPLGDPFERFYRGAVEGTLALGGGREDLLSVIRLTPSGEPMYLSKIGQIGQSYEGVALRNGIGYACRHGDGLDIIGISTNGIITNRSAISSLVNAWDVDLLGNYAYVADGAGGLAVIDITDPFSPVHLTSLPTRGAATDVVVEGNLAVVCCGSAGIDIFTLDDPANPLLRGNANTSGLAITADISGTTVYVADWDDVETFDLSNPAQPVAIGGENTPIRTMGLAVQDDLIIVADWSRLRAYRSGPSTRGDIELNLESIVFSGRIPVGAIRDTTIFIGNTGGGAITVTDVTEFSDFFSITTATSFVIPPGQTHELGIRLEHLQPGYAGTFLRIYSDDTDEPTILLPISADDNGSTLGIGEIAPPFEFFDMGGTSHSLEENTGRIVVMAFFANW